jgi:pyruvate dehydrogenase (quinone)
VLEVVTDPEVPPLPPHITFEQAKAFAGALRARDPGSAAMVKAALRGKLAEITTR